MYSKGLFVCLFICSFFPSNAIFYPMWSLQWCWCYNHWKSLLGRLVNFEPSFRQCFLNNNVTWTLQPISFPYPHKTVLRDPTRRLTTWLLSTFYRGRGDQIQCLLLNCPNTFYSGCRYFSFSTILFEQFCWSVLYCCFRSNWWYLCNFILS